jgi:hypothetical protein
MIRDIGKYLAGDALPRIRQIVGTDFLLAVAIGFVCAKWGERFLPIAAIKGTDIATALLTYTALALGFCLAGLTLVLTLPSKELLQAMVTSKPIGAISNAYGDLIFIFSWTAFSHWIAVAVSLGLLLFGGGQALWVSQPSTKFRVIAGILSAMTVYCLFQFLTILMTLYQLARVHMAFQKNHPGN